MYLILRSLIVCNITVFLQTTLMISRWSLVSVYSLNMVASSHKYIAQLAQLSTQKESHDRLYMIIYYILDIRKRHFLIGCVNSLHYLCLYMWYISQVNLAPYHFDKFELHAAASIMKGRCYPYQPRALNTAIDAIWISIKYISLQTKEARVVYQTTSHNQQCTHRIDT